MSDAPQAQDFHAGFQLGKMYAEVQSYLSQSGEDENGPLARTLLAAINAIGDSPDPEPAAQAVIEAWEQD